MAVNKAEEIYLMASELATSISRFGWFMPNWTVQQIPFADHWRSFQDPSIAELFDVDSSEMDLLLNYTRDPNGR